MRAQACSHAVYNDQGRNGAIAIFERWLPRGVGFAATVVFVAGAIVLGIVQGGHTSDMANMLNETRNAAANALGFQIASVAITGRKQLMPDADSRHRRY